MLSSGHVTGVGATQFDLCDISRRTAEEDLLTFLDLQISSHKGNAHGHKNTQP